MKKLTLTLLFCSISALSQAADMECMVDTIEVDHWSTGSCFSFEFTMDNNPNLAIWRIKGITKPVSEIIWMPSNSSCANNVRECRKMIRPYREYKMSAKILYADSTYETVSASAFFETGR